MRGEAMLWFVRGFGFAVAVAVVAAIVTGFVAAIGVVMMILVAVLLAAGLEPAIGWMRSRLHIRRGLAILIVYLSFFAAAILLAFLIIPAAIAQFNELGAQLPPLLSNARAWAETIEARAVADSIGGLIMFVEEALGPGAPVAPDPEIILEAGATLADVVITLITILTLVFFWLVGHQRIQRFALALVSADYRANMREAWNEVESRLGLWVRGQLILMGALFAMTSVAYFLLGLPGALLLGLIAGIAEAIPIVGPTIGAIPALFVAALTGRVDLLILVAVVYVVITIIEGNILVPLVMRNTIGVPPFLVISSLFAGAAIGGVIGALLALPLTAAAVVVLERMQARHSPVPLESASATETPPEEVTDELARSLPDRSGSAESRS